jgi:uncharacterized protein involved in tolerance to divalent cations
VAIENRRTADRRTACDRLCKQFRSLRYRWDGSVHEDAESIPLAKTTAGRYADLVDRVVEWHPHDVPCIERIDAADAHGPFAAWCADAVGSADE